MSFDPIMIGHLRESMSLLSMEDVPPTYEFYRRLFELAPDTRSLFTREIHLQAQKFSDTLKWLVAHLDHPEELSREVRALGARHRGYGVKIDHYASLGSALIWMFQHALGDHFTPEMEDAWVELYAFISLEAERGSREAAPEGTDP